MLIIGSADTPFADVSKALALRLGRRACDVLVESRRRKLLALSAVFGGFRDEASLTADVLRDCTARLNQVVHLDLASANSIDDCSSLLSRFYVVLLLSGREPAPQQSSNGQSDDGEDVLPFDLQLNCGGLNVRQIARIVAHCLYG